MESLEAEVARLELEKEKMALLNTGNSEQQYELRDLMEKKD